MNKNINGFTIVEMLITIVIIGILMTIGITSFSNIRTEVQDQDKLSKATVISQALENYYEKHGEYPDCNQIVGVSSTDASSTLDDIDPNIFASPQTLDGTNSITSCVVDPEIDTFSYIVTSDKSQYILKYREKSTNTVKEIASRHGSTYTLASPSSSPTTNVSLLVNDVIATVSTVSCTSGTPYYSISSRINDGTWSSWSHWSSTITTSQQTANDGIKYGYRAQAKCYSSDTQTSRSVIGSEATYIDPISTPSAPVVTANNVGDNTTWSWPAVTCTAGSPSYQYVYTISPSGYSSGTMPYKSNLLTFTTSTAEQTYAVSVQAKCSNAYTSSGWSGNGSASFYKQPTGSLTLIDTIEAGYNAKEIILSNDGTSAYVPNNGTDEVSTQNLSMFSRDNSTGLLTSLGTIKNGDWTRAVVISPDDKFVYVNYYGSTRTVVYSRDLSTGLLTYKSAYTSINQPGDLEITPDGLHIYAARNPSSVYRFSRNASTGALGYLGSTTPNSSYDIQDLELSPTGSHFYACFENYTRIYQYSRNVSTGALTALSPTYVLSGSPCSSMEVSPDGNFLYLTDYDSDVVYLYSRDNSTGKLTALSPATMSTGDGPYRIKISPDGLNAYITGHDDNKLYLYDRNISTGLLTPMATASIPVGVGPDVVTFSSDGTFVYVTMNQYNTGNPGMVYIFSRSL
ncbi:MAG TPA: beta-propeller fold lactonase family protein [Candidatus Saccharibacteria bacterium]|nr:beta-propeller fold lactonase family protein [Candidatus Saccharibacteria bacterium]